MPADAGMAVPPDLLERQAKIAANWKLTVVPRSKSISLPAFAPEDLVAVIVRQQNDKNGIWSLPLTVFPIDSDASTVTVPSRNGYIIQPAIEDVRPVIADELNVNDSCVALIRQANARLYCDIVTFSILLELYNAQL